MSQLLVAQRALTVPGWAKDALWRRAQAVPSLDLRFADNKSLVDVATGASLVTFTRASSGTFVDSAGVLQTAVTNVPRFDHNPTTGESLGLLVEEQRTNLLLNSGTLSTQSATVTAVAHTLHFTGTGTITLTGVSTAGPLVGTGTGEANRVSLTFTPTAGSLTLTVSGTVTNAQLEIGAFRTSYIATTGSAATRSADVCSITGSAFSSWYRQDEGSFYGEFARSAVDTRFPATFTVSDNTRQNEIYSVTGQNGSAQGQFSVTTGNVSQAYLTVTALTAPAANKVAGAFKSNDFIVAANGALSAADTSGTVPTVDRAYIGLRGDGVASINGTIRRLTFWGQRLPNNVLQKITQ